MLLVLGSRGAFRFMDSSKPSISYTHHIGGVVKIYDEAGDVAINVQLLSGESSAWKFDIKDYPMCRDLGFEGTLDMARALSACQYSEIDMLKSIREFVQELLPHAIPAMLKKAFGGDDTDARAVREREGRSVFYNCVILPLCEAIMRKLITNESGVEGMDTNEDDIVEIRTLYDDEDEYARNREIFSITAPGGVIYEAVLKELLITLMG